MFENEDVLGFKVLLNVITKDSKTELGYLYKTEFFAED